MTELRARDGSGAIHRDRTALLRSSACSRSVPAACPAGLGLSSRHLKTCRGDEPLRLLHANLYDAAVVIRDSISFDERSSPGGAIPSRLRSLTEIAVFSGSAHPLLAAEICSHLDVPLLPSRIERYANDCLGVQLQANCRERDVFIIQPLVPPVQEHLVELLLMLDAARGASAARTTVVMPHYAYARSDKKDAPRISIGARLVADLL